jgi:hypothetical protein
VTYEVSRILFLAGGVWGLGAGGAMIVKGVRAARAGRRYVFARWDGGMLDGREARPGIGGIVGATHVLVGFLFLAGVMSGRWPRPDIAFQLPTGWLDVSSGVPSGDVQSVPEDLRAAVTANASGVARYAIDLEGVEGRRFASFSGGHFRGDGNLNEQHFSDLVKRTLEHAGAGDRSNTLSREIRVLARVPVGRAVVDIDTEQGSLRMFLYIFARGSTFAVLACTMPRDWATRYETICDATAENNVRANSL